MQYGAVEELVTLGKKRPKTVFKSNIDDFDRAAITRIIYNFHKTDKRLPTIALIKPLIEERLGLQCCPNTLLKIVKELGFKWVKSVDNRKVLIEKHEVRLLRVEYLRKIAVYRREGRPIIYNDETYVNSSHTKPSAWSDGSLEGAMKPIGRGKRLIVVHAGGEMEATRSGANK